MFTFGDDNTHLIIRDVCKRCGEQGDLKTIQCNSSNEYGYAFAGGFLNVLCKFTFWQNNLEKNANKHFVT